MRKRQNDARGTVSIAFFGSAPGSLACLRAPFQVPGTPRNAARSETSPLKLVDHGNELEKSTITSPLIFVTNSRTGIYLRKYQNGHQNAIKEPPANALNALACECVNPYRGLTHTRTAASTAKKRPRSTNSEPRHAGNCRRPRDRSCTSSTTARARPGAVTVSVTEGNAGTACQSHEVTQRGESLVR